MLAQNLDGIICGFSASPELCQWRFSQVLGLCIMATALQWADAVSRVILCLTKLGAFAACLQCKILQSGL